MNQSKEEQISLLIILATFKSLHEQIYNLKGSHSGIVKKKFNVLLATFKSYENVIDKEWLKENKNVVEQLNDAITDLIYMLRDGVANKPVKEKEG